MIDFIKDLFSFSGRWNRLKFWLYPLVLSIPLFFIFIGITATASFQGYMVKAMEAQQMSIQRNLEIIQEIGNQDGLTQEEIESTQEYVNFSNQLKSIEQRIQEKKSSMMPIALITILQGICAIWYILYIYIRTVTYIKRLHDLGQPGWWSILTFVPLVSIGMLIWCGFFTGNPSKNKYGNNPLGNKEEEIKEINNEL